VFADLGFADAEELDLKAELALRLADVMKRQGLTQTAAAELTGISQPDLSRFLRGHLRDVSAERLINTIAHLSTEIDISFRIDGEPVGEPIHLTVPV
jgi:predicted XRE-type DNA-binding protein